jgi:hypothetical protein
MAVARHAYPCPNRQWAVAILIAQIALTSLAFFAWRIPRTKHEKSFAPHQRCDEMPKTGGGGVIVAEGDKSAGFALYVQNGKLVFHYNWFERERTNLHSSDPLPAGKSTVAMEFAYDGGGLGGGDRGRPTLQRVWRQAGWLRKLFGRRLHVRDVSCRQQGKAHQCSANGQRRRRSYSAR